MHAVGRGSEQQQQSKAYQRDHDEGRSRDGSTHVGPHSTAVQDAHPPGQLALEQRAHLGVEHDLEVTLQAFTHSSRDTASSQCSICQKYHV